MNKIINDPVHGFIQIKFEGIQKCIDHPYFQRLRAISQLGLTHYVYPGAHHSRFHHALGAFHLMQQAVAHLRMKGVEISKNEEESACMAILLHDIGHGPFSHTLEGKLWKGKRHEDISVELIQAMNEEFGGMLDLCIEMFLNRYSRTFFYQLISSQLDVDRLDYLKRDSFYTGVVEGNIGVDRILAMIDVRDEQIVVHEKGIMSIQNYLMTRNLMYWQVYLHKTVLGAENMLIKIFERIEELRQEGNAVLSTNLVLNKFLNSDSMSIKDYILLDDSDIWQFLKELKTHKDYILNLLSNSILNRKLYRVRTAPITLDYTPPKLERNSDIQYFQFRKSEKISAYTELNPILILKKNGKIESYEQYMRESGNLMTENNIANKEFFYYWKN